MFFCFLFIFLLTFFIFLNYMSEYSPENGARTPSFYVTVPKISSFFGRIMV